MTNCVPPAPFTSQYRTKSSNHEQSTIIFPHGQRIASPHFSLHAARLLLTFTAIPSLDQTASTKPHDHFSQEPQQQPQPTAPFCATSMAVYIAQRKVCLRIMPCAACRASPKRAELNHMCAGVQCLTDCPFSFDRWMLMFVCDVTSRRAQVAPLCEWGLVRWVGGPVRFV